MDQRIIAKFRRLERRLGQTHPAARAMAEQLSRDIVDPRIADADAIWRHAWNKPLYANTKVAIADRYVERIEEWMEGGWRTWGDPHAVLFEKVGKGSSTAAFRAVTANARHIRERTGIALHRLYAIQGAATAIRDRATRLMAPYADLVGRDARVVVMTVQAEMGPGWGHITVLHFLTELGLAIKPDLHLVRTVRHLGMAVDIKDAKVPTLRDAIAINQRVRDLVAALDGDVAPSRLRYVDKTLMDISMFGLLYRPDDTGTAISGGPCSFK